MPQYTRILNLGDSITFGARAEHGRTYPVLLEKRLARHSVPAVCINAGVNGQTSWEIVDRAWGHLGSDEWIKVCVCMMGTNDSKPAYRTPIDVYLASWDRLKRACWLTSTRLIAVEIPAIDPIGQPEYDARSIQHIQGMNLALAAWAANEGVDHIGGIYDAFSAEPASLLADGIHPNNAGNDLLADRVYGYFAQPYPSNGHSLSDEQPVIDASAGIVHLTAGDVPVFRRPIADQPQA